MSYKRARGLRRVVTAVARTSAGGIRASGALGSENNQDILVWDSGQWDEEVWAQADVQEPLEWDVGQWDVNTWDDEDVSWQGQWDVSAWDDFLWS